MRSEREKLTVALLAPVGVIFIGLMLGSHELFLGGAVFTALILGTALLRRM